jgi:hypothetical protein
VTGVQRCALRILEVVVEEEEEEEQEEVPVVDTPFWTSIKQLSLIQYLNSVGTQPADFLCFFDLSRVS